MVDESVKFAWAYLLLHGKLTDGKFEYYGSNWNDLYHDYDEQRLQMSKVREKVKEIGIDWVKTEIPEVHYEDGFAGTFNSNDRCLATLGKLVLLNGKTFLIGSSDEDAAHLAETARNILHGRNDEVVNLAKLI